ncbi:MAG: TIM barrel protein [Actinomyces sp.]|uniref:sugar phosphate isomerase/epimerase family protein n=1 Tax=Actinomyces sp. TaxID=29317 RepID=UPI0026DB4045|nr:TIM barrel protein [Actinomyces sp.]MDO4242472.1 TIM barrel protein [Actinomyces sp.]
MVDIALDPNMYYATMSTADTLHKAAELGFRFVELSPNHEFHLWHHYPKADRAFIEELRKAQRDSGVAVRTLNPVFNWSSPDEAERQAQVRDWRRLLELADALEVHVADGFNHRANGGNRYIINPPGADVTVHQHNAIGMGEVPWDEVFPALCEVGFDGIVSVCIFGWHERADEYNKAALARLNAELGA